jgi:hypothetical protein
MPPAFTYTIFRSLRKTIAITIDRTGTVVVKAPVIMPKIVIDKFVLSKSEWITTHLSKIKILSKTKTTTLQEGESFLYLGEKRILTVGNFSQIVVKESKLYFPKALLFRIAKELPAWYLKQAKSVITTRVHHYEEALKVKAEGITFSDTISKWGSCTHDNRLQFNWRLIMAPILVIDYVVVHELVHIRIKNHSRKFWFEVAKYKPAHKQYRKWLTEHAGLLQGALPKN